MAASEISEKLESLLKERNRWQEETIKAVKKQLIFREESLKSEEQEKREAEEKAERIIIVYGNTQRGKTTLILQLLGGIKEDDNRHVEDILRGKEELGNSSTSTAILYQKTNNDRFGLKFEKGFEKSELGMKFCSDKEFVDELAKIRNDVEGDKDINGLLHIAIPRKYFENDTDENNNLNILDLPGIGSRNKNEKRHLSALISKYVEVANFNIIVEKMNQIQNLPDLDVHSYENWWSLPLSYMIVLTYAFSEESVDFKDYLKKDRGLEDFTNDIEETLRKTFKGEDKPIDERMEIYALEIGSSFKTFLRDKITNESDRTKVREYVRNTISKMRESLKRKKGNTLTAIIEGYCQHSIKSEEAFNKEIKEEIDEKNKEMEKKKEDKQVQTTKLEAFYKAKGVSGEKSLDKELDELKRKADTLQRLSYKSHNPKDEIQSIYSALSEIRYLTGKTWLSEDKINSITAEFDNQTKMFIYTEIERSSIFKEIFGDISNDEIYKSFRNYYYESYNDKLKEKLRRKLSDHHFPNIFNSHTNIEIQRNIDDCFGKFADRFDEFMNYRIRLAIEEYEAERSKLNSIKAACRTLNNIIETLGKEISQLKKESESLKTERKTSEKRLKSYKNQINVWNNIARQKFYDEKHRIYEKMKQRGLSKKDKVCYVIYLGIIESDFNKEIASKEEIYNG